MCAMIKEGIRAEYRSFMDDIHCQLFSVFIGKENTQSSAVDNVKITCLLISLLKNMIHRTVHQGTMFHQQCNYMVVQFHELIVVLATVFCQRHVYDLCVRWTR